MNTFASLMAEVRELDARLTQALPNVSNKGAALAMKLTHFMKMGDALDAALSLIAEDDPQRARVQRFLNMIIGLVDSTVAELQALDGKQAFADAVAEARQATLH